MNDPDPVPSYFTVGYMFRYVLWWLWSNPVSVLGTLQIIFQTLTLPDPNTGNPPVQLSHAAIHWIAIANLILLVIIAQVRKRLPFNPPPTKPNSP